MWFLPLGSYTITLDNLFSRSAVLEIGGAWGGLDRGVVGAEADLWQSTTAAAFHGLGCRVDAAAAWLSHVVLVDCDGTESWHYILYYYSERNLSASASTACPEAWVTGTSDSASAETDLGQPHVGEGLGSRVRERFDSGSGDLRDDLLGVWVVPHGLGS